MPVYQPVGDRVLVRRDEKEAKAGRFIIPDEYRKLSHFGTVVAVGPGGRDRLTGALIPMEVAPGDRVRYGSYVGEHFDTDIDGVPHVFLHMGDIQGVVQ
jgi:chaperonin GroES